jgi:hypothetical protein
MFGVTMTDHFEPNLTDFWNHPRIMPNVPQREIGLEGYLVRRVTQTVDYITWTRHCLKRLSAHQTEITSDEHQLDHAGEVFCGFLEA